MNNISINTAKRIIPMIYAYTTPEIKRHDGWTKIGCSFCKYSFRMNTLRKIVQI